jgi:hypothetical protein
LLGNFNSFEIAEIWKKIGRVEVAKQEYISESLEGRSCFGLLGNFNSFEIAEICVIPWLNVNAQKGKPNPFSGHYPDAVRRSLCVCQRYTVLPTLASAIIRTLAIFPIAHLLHAYEVTNSASGPHDEPESAITSPVCATRLLMLQHLCCNDHPFLEL